MLHTKSDVVKYFGPDFTYDKIYDGFFVGILVGIKANINEAVGVFGEIGLNAGLQGDGISDLGLINTGIGICYYFK